MKQKIIPILIVLTGFLLLFYPFTSNYLFEKSAGSTVESYQEKAAGMDQAIIKKVMDEAKQYNGELMRSSVQLTDPFKEKRLDGETVHYNRILNIDGSSIMGYLKIPCISWDKWDSFGTWDRTSGCIFLSDWRKRYPCGADWTYWA